MAKVRVRKFDPANDLRSEKDLALYLDACFKEGGDDAAFIAAALGDIARARGIIDRAADEKVTR